MNLIHILLKLISLCRLSQIACSPSTTILYESCHRIVATLKDLASVLGNDRRVCICRELTKLHETITHCSIGDVRELT